ncbi:MAG: S-layer homology domain-containing protein [Candidatus Peribacteria bacterium]|nr:S-layer homology domain-containing protein [Candidatus Peribacteria bacterium]
MPEAAEYKGLFTDVKETVPNEWAWKSVESLGEAGLITTTNKTFNPETNVSKAEAIGMIVKAIYGDAYSYNSEL